MTEPRLYAIPLFAHEAAGVRVSEVCWGSCGKGCIGAIRLDNGDEAIPCVTPAEKCPAFDKETDAPFGTVPDGRNLERPVYLRKIKLPLRVIKPTLHERMQQFRRAVGHPRYWPGLLRRWLFPAPPACETCGTALRDHKPLPAKDADTLLDREGWYGGRMRVQRDNIFVSVIDYRCDGSVIGSLLLLESDAECLRDALDRYLTEGGIND